MMASTTGLRHRGRPEGAGSSSAAAASQAKAQPASSARSMVESLALSLLSLPPQELLTRLNTISDKLLRKPFVHFSSISPNQLKGNAVIFKDKNRNESLQLAETVTFNSSEEDKQELLNMLTHPSFGPFKAFVEYAYPMMKCLQDDPSHFILNEARRKVFSEKVGDALSQLISQGHQYEFQGLADSIGLNLGDVSCFTRRSDGYYECRLPAQFKEETADQYAKSMAQSILLFEGFMNRNDLLNHLDLRDFNSKLGAIFTKWNDSEDQDIEAFFKREIQELKHMLELEFEPGTAKKYASTIFGLHFTLLVMGYNGLAPLELRNVYDLFDEIKGSERSFEVSGSTVKLLEHIQKQTWFFRPVEIKERGVQEIGLLSSFFLLTKQQTPNAFKLLFKLIPHQDDIIDRSRDLKRAPDHLVTKNLRAMSDDQFFLKWCLPIGVEGLSNTVFLLLSGQSMHLLKSSVVSISRVYSRQFLSKGLQLDQVPNDDSSLSTARHYVKNEISEFFVFAGSQFHDFLIHMSMYRDPPSLPSVGPREYVQYRAKMSAISNGLSFLKLVYDACSTHSEKRDPKQIMSKFLQCVMQIMMFYFLLLPEESHYRETEFVPYALPTYEFTSQAMTLFPEQEGDL